MGRGTFYHLVICKIIKKLCILDTHLSTTCVLCHIARWRHLIQFLENLHATYTDRRHWRHSLNILERRLLQTSIVSLSDINRSHSLKSDTIQFSFVYINKNSMWINFELQCNKEIIHRGKEIFFHFHSRQRTLAKFQSEINSAKFYLCRICAYVFRNVTCTHTEIFV